MCLAFVAIGQDPEYPLILLFNRDEDYERETAAAHWWPGENIYAGRDLLKGGTWAAVAKDGRFAMLTFVRGPREDRIPGIARGEIVPNWMRSDGDFDAFLARLQGEAEQTLGYNLIFGNREQVRYFNNRSGEHAELGEGIHGVSNADLREEWFKVKRGRERLAEIIQSKHKGWKDECLALLRDSTLAPHEQVQVTGLNPERERLKSGLFVSLKEYGTIASSLVCLRRDGLLSVYEQSYLAGAVKGGLIREAFLVEE